MANNLIRKTKEKHVQKYINVVPCMYIMSDILYNKICIAIIAGKASETLNFHWWEGFFSGWMDQQ